MVRQHFHFSISITPDLAAFGKAVAGGLPLSAVVGKKEVMKLVAESEVFHMGTLNGNTLFTSGALAPIKVLEENNRENYGKMKALSKELANDMSNIASNFNIPFEINSLGSVFHTMIIDSEVSTYEKFSKRDSLAFSKLAEYLLEEGDMVRPSGLWYLSISHTARDIEETLEKFEKAARSYASMNN